MLNSFFLEINQNFLFQIFWGFVVLIVGFIVARIIQKKEIAKKILEEWKEKL